MKLIPRYLHPDYQDRDAGDVFVARLVTEQTKHLLVRDKHGDMAGFVAQTILHAKGMSGDDPGFKFDTPNIAEV